MPKMPKQVLFVKRGLGRIQLGPRTETDEGIKIAPPYLHFVPWDVEYVGDIKKRWGMFKCSEAIYEDLFGDVELFNHVSTYPKFLAHFLGRGDIYAACPLTGKKFTSLEEYVKYMDQLKGSVGDLFD